MSAHASEHIAALSVRFAAISDEAVKGVLGIIDDEKACVRDRVDEAIKGVAAVAQLRAIYRMQMFWLLAAMLPRNDLSIPQPLGRPRDYPDWLLFLLECVAGIAGIATRHAAIVAISDPQAWAAFVYDVDRFVPEGMTKLKDVRRLRPLPKRPPKTLAVAQTKRTDELLTLVPKAEPGHLVPVPDLEPPLPHHSAYFLLGWRGVDKKGNRLPSTSPWHGLRRRIMARFRELSIQQAQAMGALPPGSEFFFKDPNPLNFIGVDGSVWPLARKGKTPSASEHGVGGNTKNVYGSKYTLFSIRIVGQYLSRLIFDFTHTGKDKEHSLANDEAAAISLIAPELQALTNGGMLGIVVDSVIRGDAVTELQRRHGLIVVNHVYAESNPDGKAGKRHNATRKEKSHLRSTLRHIGKANIACEHPLFLYGGHLVEMVTDGDGHDQPRKVEIIKYLRYRNKDGSWREYHHVKIPCPLAPDGFITKRVALFHDAEDDPKFNYGEYARTLPPHTDAFQRLYSTRNDTEARHADLKARTKFFPRDVPGQEVRLLGACIANNALALHVHLQAHGLPNAIDNTG